MPVSFSTGTTCVNLSCYMILNDTEMKAISFICFLAGPFTFLENILVLAVIASATNLRRRPSYLFIGSLALADIFASCFFTVSFLDFHLYKRIDSRKAYLFKLGGVTMAFTGSVGSLFLTALDRYLCIYRASRYKVMLTHRRALLALLVLWSATVLISFLPFLGWECFTWHSKPCLRLFPYIDPLYLGCWATFILILLLLIMSAYALILWRANRHEASMTGLQAASAGGQARMRMDIRLARTLGLILLILAGCWLPVLSFMLADVSVVLTRTQQRAFAFCSTLCLINSAVNPLLYALRCQELRTALMRLLESTCKGLGGFQRCAERDPDTSSANHLGESNSCSVYSVGDAHRTAGCRQSTVSLKVDNQQLDIIFVNEKGGGAYHVSGV
uniref:G-protein coupled receptors family 1 profile domain-containing protein n=1 Tax=Esox lucius TaxID=8010 RepID=A0AAY5KFE1_ESOLU